MNASEQARAEKIKATMEEAILEGDIDKFRSTYEKTLSHWYMPAKERKAYYMRFIKRAAELREEA